jgi:hypothetical protein
MKLGYFRITDYFSNEDLEFASDHWMQTEAITQQLTSRRYFVNDKQAALHRQRTTIAQQQGKCAMTKSPASARERMEDMPCREKPLE